MRKLNKKFIIFLFVILIFGIYFLFGRKDIYSLSTGEKNWLSAYNKTMNSITFINDYPVYSGEGGVFESLYNHVKDATQIDFNQLSNKKEEVINFEKYAFRYLKTDEKVKKNDFVINEDNYVAVGREYLNINGEEDLRGKKVGVLQGDSENISYYLRSVPGIKYTIYTGVDELTNSLKSSSVDLIILPHIMYLDKILSNKFIINYSFIDMTNRLVFTVDDNPKIISIMDKLFSGWYKERFKEVYNDKLLNYYVSATGITDARKKEVASKKYTYGFVDNAPYELVINDKLKGINGEYLSRLSRFANIEFNFKKYKDLKSLQEDIKNNKVDIFFNYFDMNQEGYSATNSSFVEKYAVLTKDSNFEVVNSIESLKDREVFTIKNTSIYNYFKDKSKADIKAVKNLNEAIKKGKESILVIDYETYNYYRNSKLKDFKLLHQDFFDKNYSFVVNNKHKELFEMFNYIINSNSFYKYRDVALVNLSLYNKTSSIKKLMILVALLIAVLPAFMLLIQKIKNKEKIFTIKDLKINKGKYLDVLTFLKNRNYLNASLNIWNKVEGPQGIVAIDLNNIKYINDKYGYEKGDEEIKNAASILLRTQLEQSEIMRTSGNEFIVYLLGYSPEVIKAYVERLKKEFNELSCGYGASIGYAYMSDDILTIEDAISEALFNMRKDKCKNEKESN